MTILYRDNGEGNVYEAFNELNKCAFGIWFYLKDTRDNYITPNLLKEKIGIGRTQYYKAIEELVEAGYLVVIKEKVYEFFAGKV